MTSTTAPPPSRHLRALEGAHVVRHLSYDVAHEELINAIRFANTVAIYGPAGSGKTFAVNEFVRRLNDTNPNVRTAWIEIPHKPRGKALPVRILKALYGSADDSLTEDALLVDSVTALAEQKTLLVIDEADHLRTEGLFQVKHLFDEVNFGRHPNAQLGIALIGVDLPRTLAMDEQLASRVVTKVKFRPLEGTELFDTLDAYHPVLAKTDDLLIQELDERCCRGSFRRWAQVLQKALNPIDGSDAPEQIDRPTAERIIARMER